MLGNNNTNSNKNLVILRPITRDENKKDINATFQVLRANTEGKFEKVDTCPSVTGDLFRIETTESTWEDKVKKGFRIFLKDDAENENYLIDCKFNILTRDMLNRVLGLESFSNVTISLYRNKKGYNSSYVKAGETPSKWKYDFNELPKPDEIINPRTNEVIQRDFTALDDFFINAINEFCEKNNFNNTSKSSQGNKTDSPSNESTDAEINNDEDWI